MNERSLIFVFILGTLILFIFSFTLIIFLIHYKRKQQHHLTEKMNLEHQYNTQLLQSRLEVQEQAFQYLSEEIHDNVGQALSLVKLQLYQLNQQSAESKSSELIANSTELLTKAIGDLRNISHNLNGKYIAKTGLVEAVQKELRYVGAAKSVRANFEMSGAFYPIDPEKELLIFRIIQEAIANAIKHAYAKNIKIVFTYFPALFSFTVADDGVGFDPKDPSSKQGLGLDNMRQRVDLLKGNLIVDATKENGTIIAVTINLSNERTE